MGIKHVAMVTDEVVIPTLVIFHLSLINYPTSFVLFHLSLSAQTIQQLMNSTEKTCHCHGISGSCTFSICHSELPDFEQVAKNIQKAYENSCRVTSTGQSQNQWVSQCGRDYTATDMIYRDIANWCQVNHFTGSVGVVGRECSPHLDAPNSCKKLCNDQCGRGSKDFVEVQEKQCGCKFLFCCEIHCDMCTEERKYYRCT